MPRKLLSVCVLGAVALSASALGGCYVRTRAHPVYVRPAHRVYVAPPAQTVVVQPAVYAAPPAASATVYVR